MKIALKYGLFITAGVVLFTLIGHNVTSNHGLVTNAGAVVFNILHFTCIFLGIKALEREQNQKPSFKEGLKHGISISFVYAISSALYFVVVLLVIGTKWLEGEVKSDLPIWVDVLRAFAGLVVISMILGLVYSTLISFVLARKLSEEDEV